MNTSMQIIVDQLSRSVYAPIDPNKTDCARSHILGFLQEATREWTNREISDLLDISISATKAATNQLSGAGEIGRRVTKRIIFYSRRAA